MRRLVAFARTALSAGVLVLSGLALLAGVIVPKAAGATAFTLTTGSMAPRLPVGTLAVVKPALKIKIGDIISFHPKPGSPLIATHRVIGVGTTSGGEATFVTKGDANNGPDLAPVLAHQVVGRLWYTVPYVGHLARLQQGPQRWAGLGVAAGLLVYAAWQVRAALRTKEVAAT